MAMKFSSPGFFRRRELTFLSPPQRVQVNRLELRARPIPTCEAVKVASALLLATVVVFHGAPLSGVGSLRSPVLTCAPWVTHRFHTLSSVV